MTEYFLTNLDEIHFEWFEKKQTSKEFSRHDDSIPYLDNA